MSVVTPTVALAELSIGDLLSLGDDVRRELLGRGVDTSKRPVCEHPMRRASDMKAPDGRLVCNFCSATANGLQPRNVEYLQSLEAGETSSEWVRPQHTPMAGDLK